MSQKPFAVFDIDGTIIRWQLYHAVVNRLAKEGKIPSGVGDTIRQARTTWKDRTHTESFSEYEDTLLHSFHDVLQKVKVSDYKEAVDWVFETHKDQVYRHTRDMVKSLKAEGYLLFAVSGSQQEVVEKLGDYYGFDEVIGGRYAVEGDNFTGERTSPVVSGKRPLVQELVARHNATWQGSYAFGDSISDAQMLELVDHPVAFNPDRNLFDRATKEGWTIIVERKNMIYTLEKQNDKYFLA